MDERPNNVCILPSQKDIWTIHGIWPTKYGTIGPQFCNKTESFDINTLKPLLNQLTQFWLNVEKGRITLDLNTSLSVVNDISPVTTDFL